MKKKWIVLGMVVLLISYVALPKDIKAKTIQQFEEEVERYTKELEEKQANLVRNDEEIAAITKKIQGIEAQIKEAEDEIERLQEEIEKSEEEIKKKSEESKSIISYYQIANGENAYLEYAFGATDITDMIYRLSVVEQLTEYNDKIMKELEELIRQNQIKQAELVKKEEELNKLRKSLESEIARIEIDSAAIKETLPSVQDQIKSAKESVTYYKNLGCGDSEDIQQCEYRVARETGSSLPSVGFFQRPISNGYVVRGKSWDHLGYDLSSSDKSIAVYPIASGMIHKIYTDSCTTDYPNWCRRMGYSCNGNAKIVVVKHNYNGGFIYSSYVHLRSYGDIYEGMFVSQSTIIGYMGTSGCSTGPHLHLEIGTCFWKNGGCNYDTYKTRLLNPGNLISFPGSWTNR
ncbi:MAG: peptidoglycan DD-metalloendopeptidase family protein [Bacilli bacterium]|nr:peptidoglycan DD-metalloendopeptidase family protein [Bacilli bacterium]